MNFLEGGVLKWSKEFTNNIRNLFEKVGEVQITVLLAVIFIFTTVGWFIYFLLGKNVTPIPAAVFATLVGVSINHFGKAVDKERQRSEFYLASALDGFKEAYQVLEEGQNERVVWISAARILQRAINISKKISQQEHREILEMQHDRYRHMFYNFLGPHGSEISGAYFYGSSDPDATIENAAKESTASSTRRRRTIINDVKELSESSISVIWKFAKFPDDYEDPLNDKFTEQEISSMTVLFPGLHEYLNHKRLFYSINGKLTKRTEKKEP